MRKFEKEQVKNPSLNDFNLHKRKAKAENPQEQGLRARASFNNFTSVIATVWSVAVLIISKQVHGYTKKYQRLEDIKANGNAHVAETEQHAHHIVNQLSQSQPLENPPS